MTDPHPRTKSTPTDRTLHDRRECHHLCARCNQRVKIRTDLAGTGMPRDWRTAFAPPLMPNLPKKEHRNGAAPKSLQNSKVPHRPPSVT